MYLQTENVMKTCISLFGKDYVLSVSSDFVCVLARVCDLWIIKLFYCFATCAICVSSFWLL